MTFNKFSLAALAALSVTAAAGQAFASPSDEAFNSFRSICGAAGTTLANIVRAQLRDQAGIEYEIPVLRSSSAEATLLVPAGVTLGAAIMTVTGAGFETQLNVQVDRTAPGLFTAKGDGTGPPLGYFLLRTASGEESVVEAYACEAGKCVSKPVEWNDLATELFLIMQGTGFRNLAEPAKVEAWAGGVSAEVVSVTPLEDGRDQIALRMPREIAGAGLVEIVLSAGDLPANAVWIATSSETSYPPPLSWDFSRDTEGWIANNLLSHRVEAGMWQMDPGNDPYLMGPTISVDAGTYKYIRVRMSVACRGQGQIYFKTADNNSFTEARKLNFDPKGCLLCTTPAPFVMHSFDMSGHPQWAGTITAIRLDPCDAGVAGTEADVVKVDSIRLSATP